MTDNVPNLPTEVTVPLDFTSYLSTYSGPDADGEYARHPATFEEIITERVACILAEKATKDRTQYQGFGKRVDERIGEIVAEKVDGEIVRMLTEPRTPTDVYGQAKGEPTTLNEIILTRVRNHLNTVERDTYNRNKGKTRLQVLADEAIDRHFDADVKKAITEAQDSVRQQVATRAAEVMTKAMKEAL